jgi:hypothetical protein
MSTDLRAIVDRFVREITVTIQSEVQAALSGAFGAEAGRGRRGGRAGGRTARSAAPAARGRGGKRTSDELDALAAKLRGYVVKHPGERIEHISKALGVSSKELALPVRKLIADKAISTKGQRRATKYFAVGSR